MQKKTKCPNCGLTVFQCGFKDKEHKQPYYLELFAGMALVPHYCKVKK